ncbi:hypothetical protein OAU25_00770 [Crocinitomicaceae bacterium]|nr:hypothetical protein [Crocinitomicaceae bacterium]
MHNYKQHIQHFPLLNLREAILIAVILCFCLLSVHASEVDLKETPPDSSSSILNQAAAAIMIENGKTDYKTGKVRNALIKFRQASIKDPFSWKAVYNISKCHYTLNNYGFALKYAKKAIELGADRGDKEIYHLLGRSYHRLEAIDSAVLNFQLAIKYLSKNRIKELQIRRDLGQCEYAKKALANGKAHTPIRMKGEMNSGFDDYGVVMTDKGQTMYFTSRRSNTTGGALNPYDQLFFEDVYKTTYNETKGEWSEVTNQLGKLNSKGFESFNYIAPEGNYGVLTLNTTMTDTDNKTRVSDICVTKKNKNGTWNAPKLIDNKSINTSFWDAAATLTADGNTMVFVTDRKGEKSSSDLYIVKKSGKTWGIAEPLKELNSKGAETTPYLTPDGKYLFFSSDGHESMGGKDVLVSKNINGTWSVPKNLGAGINTVNDDLFFVYNQESGKAYISGYHIVGNKSSLDIFEIDMKEFSFPE